MTCCDCEYETLGCVSAEMLCSKIDDENMSASIWRCVANKMVISDWRERQACRETEIVASGWLTISQREVKGLCLLPLLSDRPTVNILINMSCWLLLCWQLIAVSKYEQSWMYWSEKPVFWRQNLLSRFSLGWWWLLFSFCNDIMNPHPCWDSTTVQQVEFLETCMKTATWLLHRGMWPPPPPRWADLVPVGVGRLIITEGVTTFSLTVDALFTQNHSIARNVLLWVITTILLCRCLTIWGVGVVFEEAC